MTKCSYRLFYSLWAALFALTAVLGLLFPNVTDGAARLPLLAVSLAFFLPPWLILAKARKEGNRKHRILVRNLALTSLVLTVVLLCANILSAGRGELLGNVLNALLTVVSAPMVCSNYYLVPLFLWGTLLMGARRSR